MRIWYLTGAPKLNSLEVYSINPGLMFPVYYPIPFLQSIYGKIIFVYYHTHLRKERKSIDFEYVSCDS